MLVRLLIRFFVTGILVSAISVVTTLLILKNGIDNKITQLDKAARLVAGQVSSANLNAILGFTNDYFIFIIHKRDGRLLFESAKRPESELPVWEGNKFIVFKEMLLNDEGTIVYPETESWAFSTKKILKYIALPDLDWVLAVELPASVTSGQLAKVYSPLVIAGLSLASLIVAFCFSIGDFRKKPRAEISASEAPREELPANPEPIREPTPAAPTPRTAEDYLYQKRLIAEARRQLESGKQSVPVVNAVAQSPQENPKEETPVAKEVVADQIKEPEVAQPPPPSTPPEAEKTAQTANPTEIYFDKLLEKKKGKPTSIIGMALSKKQNREKLDT